MMMSKARYAAMYETGEKGKNYFRFVYLEFPDGMIPPFKIEMGVPQHGVHEFGLADDQHALASIFSTSQQNVSRWLKNKAPEFPR
jgi:hypothetical protein